MVLEGGDRHELAPPSQPSMAGARLVMTVLDHFQSWLFHVWINFVVLRSTHTQRRWHRLNTERAIASEVQNRISA
jgi:hypothetical protein